MPNEAVFTPTGMVYWPDSLIHIPDVTDAEVMSETVELPFGWATRCTVPIDEAALT